MSSPLIIRENLEKILDNSVFELSNIKPSEWMEKNRVMKSGESQFLGKFSYDLTPYLREIIDSLSYISPARIISIMKGAQLGFTVGVIEGAIGYFISEEPCNILFLTGHADLSEEAMERIDGMIDNTGIRHLIKPTALRARAMKTGDTNKSKEFAGGRLVAGSANNHKLLRQRSVKVIFVDDFDNAKNSDKASGSTRSMIEQRGASYYSQMKICYISTPETRPSNIEQVYLEGDQRKYHMPCPCCGEYIIFQWSIPIENSDEMGGITWKVDEENKVIKESVGYICYKCGGFFTDKHKAEMLKNGKWIPTAKPLMEGNVSYLIPSLYAPIGMFDWYYYVNRYLKANPIGGKRDEKLHQTFLNLVLGEPYEPSGEEIKSTELQRNIRNYQLGVIPESLSEKDGNGKIVMVTMGIDLNGKEDDARLDYEIVAWAETGVSYSVNHGSIGTFIPREGGKETDRERFTYRHGMTMSVWGELEKIVTTKIPTDKGRNMMIFAVGLDIGYQTTYANQWLDVTNAAFAIGIKGLDDSNKYIPIGKDARSFKQSREHPKLFLMESNVLKDRLADLVRLNWNSNLTDVQPKGFMNFPIPSDGKYLYTNFFSHYEAEHKVMDKDTTYRWIKKSDNVQNHLWDCRLYNHVAKDVLVSKICKEAKIINSSWEDYVKILVR